MDDLKTKIYINELMTGFSDWISVIWEGRTLLWQTLEGSGFCIKVAFRPPYKLTLYNIWIIYSNLIWSITAFMKEFRDKNWEGDKAFPSPECPYEYTKGQYHYYLWVFNILHMLNTVLTDHVEINLSWNAQDHDGNICHQFVLALFSSCRSPSGTPPQTQTWNYYIIRGLNL